MKLSDPDPKHMSNLFTETILSIFTDNIPNQIIKCNDKDPPWISSEIKTAIKRKHRVILDPKLSFSADIHAAISKSRKAIGMLGFFSKYLSRNTLNQLFKLYVRPRLDYDDVIYHILQKEENISSFGKNLMEKLESVPGVPEKFNATDLIKANGKNLDPIDSE